MALRRWEHVSWGLLGSNQSRELSISITSNILGRRVGERGYLSGVTPRTPRDCLCRVEMLPGAEETQVWLVS